MKYSDMDLMIFLPALIVKKKGKHTVSSIRIASISF